MNKGKKIIISIIAAIIVIIIGIVGVYFASFSPKVATTPLTANISLNTGDLLKDIIPDHFSFNSNGLNMSTSASFTAQQLTDIAILGVKNNDTVKKYINGLKFEIDGKYIDVFADTNFYGIPVEEKVVLEPFVQNGKAAMHFVSCNVGFIKVPQSLIFSKLKNTANITIDEATGNIVISPSNMKQIIVTKFATNGDKLDFDIKADISFKGLNL